ncbi:LOW QUALITY PROTEIN: ATP-binding cassette sub-family A member 2-like [Paramacrobiotus metropolitanus]|uniref:LOW QUALITY PROTEIN: ATP-binding cassette sub-family A member 2-like n=1 Tax=Paramacrobiotus metropolitanus TaxID=2943436 RepID=UPI002445EE8F|nr:LOW QUALITY PROTEIN: ATP-binding cassette sub-family A member 2-like [Paramacrobiotus metropolitanus]
MAADVKCETDTSSRMSAYFSQLLLMIRRNLLLKRRSTKLAILELVVPTFFLIEFIFLGCLMSARNEAFPAVPEFVEEPLPYPGVPFREYGSFYAVGYTPDNPAAAFILNYTSVWWNRLNTSNALYTAAFPSEEDVDSIYLNDTFPAIGLVFHDATFRSLNYSLRFPNQWLPPTSRPFFRYGLASCRPYNTTTTDHPNMCPANSYALAGFTALQNLISTAYTIWKSNGTLAGLTPLHLTTKLMPTEATTVLRGDAQLAGIPAQYLANLLGFYVIFLVIGVVTEKQRQHIHSMRLMGLRGSVYWLSWLLIYAGIMLLASVSALLLARYLSIWPRSSFLLLLLDCMLFGLSVIALGFCILPLVQRPLIAGLMTFALMEIFGFLYLAEVFAPMMAEAGKWGMAILSPAAFFMTLSRVAKAEASGWGISFENAMDADGSGSAAPFSFGFALIMLLVDLGVYSLLAVYLAKVMILPSCCRGSSCHLPIGVLLNKRNPLPRPATMPTSGGFSIPATWKFLRTNCETTAVIFDDVRKVYAQPKGHPVAAVDSFTYEAYEGEILAILGHNGAGKSTLINMLTDLTALTSGTILVYGKNVSDPLQLRQLRRTMGVCPQSNGVLFDTLTVQEHLQFYARLKGYSNEVVAEKCRRVLKETGLDAHATQPAQRLSGGQQRRLCLAVAAIGDPRLLVLDEPTSGIDPYSQRLIWEMLRGMRTDRAIILTTQSMEEADILADRKLIMRRGRLCCAGTSWFLKKRFGQGYHLTVLLDKDADEADEAALTQVVREFVAEAAPGRSHAAHVTFVLPNTDTSALARLFRYLDDNLQLLKVKSYGVSLSTMEEIFLALTAEADDDTNTRKKAGICDSGLTSTVFTAADSGDNIPWWKKFTYLVRVRLLLMLRSRLSLAFHVVIPVMLLLMNGGMSIMSAQWKAKLLGLEPLNLNDIGDEFISRNARYFVDDRAGAHLDHLVEQLNRSRVPFDTMPYRELPSSPNHAGGFIIHNSSASEQGFAASLVYNGTSQHGLPFSVNLLLNAVHNWLTAANETFTVTIHPFPALKPGLVQLLLDTMLGSLLFNVAVVLIPGVYGVDMCRDREIGMRRQLRMTGCPAALYWTSAFLAHWLHYAAAFAFMLGLLFAFSVAALTQAVGALLLLFLLYAPAVILAAYCFSFLFARMDMAAVGIPFPIAVLTFLLYLIVCVLDAFGEAGSAQTVHYVLTFLFPFYGFFGATFYLQKTGQNSANRGYFEWSSNIPVVFIAHSVHIPLLILLLRYLDGRDMRPAPSSGCLSPVQSAEDPGARPDQDVEDERVIAGKIDPEAESKSYSVLLRSLYKSYNKRCRLASALRKQSISEQHVAVRDLSVVVRPGEIFGLLGPNGAGKSSTLSMVTAEVAASRGEVHVAGYSVTEETQRAMQCTRYCPQRDPLWDDLSLREHLQLFALLNDVPQQQQADYLHTLTDALQLREHLDKRACQLSGGTKRKLSLLISLIGRAPLLLLDEATTGLDPHSKRRVWGLLRAAARGRGVLLSTHSMDEADALCDRIGILVNGQLQCLGSAQHLKDKFGSGYLLQIKTPHLPPPGDHDDTTDAQTTIITAVQREFPHARLLEEAGQLVTFALPREELPALGTVFLQLDALQQQLQLEEFGISQTSLEQVFVRFARMQTAADALPDSPA